jgi:hypothetical protein
MGPRRRYTLERLGVDHQRWYAGQGVFPRQR